MVLIISEHDVFRNKKAINPASDMSCSTPTVVPGMDAIIGVEVNQVIIINESLEEFVFLCEHVPSSSLILKRGDEIGVATEDVNRMGLVHNEPLEEIKKGGFFIRDLGSIDIGYSAMYIGSNGVKEGSDGVV